MASRDPLARLRRDIDNLDDQLLDILNRRAKIAQAIGKVKAESGTAIFASDRESGILSRLAAKNRGPLPSEAIEDVFQPIFASSRALQRQYTVAFFGPESTFTHMAAIRFFGRGCEFVPVPSIKDVFFEVERKRADFGVVPVENSTEGVVNHTLDMFIESPLYIVAQREEPISHNLLSVSGKLKAVKSVYSHPQALAQCRRWLDTHLPGVTLHNAASTADAAVHATLDGSCAAIASQLAGQMYHLRPVAQKIEDMPDNATRFLVIGRTMAAPTGRDKTSIVFSIKDRVGALYDMLIPFRDNRINLTKIESRPTKRKAWEYLFFVDFAGHQDEPRVRKALAALRKRCETLKILGSYPYAA